MKKVTIKLPDDMARAIRQIAQDEDVSVGQVIRHSLEEVFEPPKMRVGPDQQTMRLLKAHIIDDIDAARDWMDLSQRLAAKGYELRSSGGGIAVFRSDGLKICRGSDLGRAFTRLMNRYGVPRPGQLRSAPIDRVLL